MTAHPDELGELLDVALDVARAAEGPILAFHRRATVSHKPDGSEVTEADRRGEEAMRELLARRFPDHGVVGEEFGASGSRGARWQWLLDPVDGTASFTLGVPIFGTLVGLLRDGEPVVGVIHFPALAETVYAATGAGCWFREGDAAAVRVRVGAARKLAHATVLAPTGYGAGSPEDRERWFTGTLPLMRGARKFRCCGDCFQYAVVCRGLAHAAIDPVMHPWDIAALVPCLEEAGGVVSAVNGRREGVVFGGSFVASCDSALHREVLATLTAPGGW